MEFPLASDVSLNATSNHMCKSQLHHISTLSQVDAGYLGEQL